MEETKLFQFLNGLNEVYNPQRSQLLLTLPLPSVETVPEEAQRDILNVTKVEHDNLAMFSKTVLVRTVICTACGGKGNRGDRCWTVVGFSRWHPSHVTHPQPNITRPRNFTPSSNPKWNGRNRPTAAPKMAATAHQASTDSTPLFTQQQLDQLAKLMPQMMQNSPGYETDEELDVHFSGMITCHNATTIGTKWIIDSGASDHMTHFLYNLQQPTSMNNVTNINLPTGDMAIITHTGNATLKNGIVLKEVFCVPTFKHNFLSVQKLVKDSN